mgnify:CR=1 FL=1|tara:strand:- start:51038 stop:51448 length:411 start_codon:yes stop_codon:yes gene_type:complete
MRIKKNDKVIKLTENDLKRIVKRVLTEQNYDYEYIENLDDAKKLYKLILDAMGVFMDDEAIIEAAFMAFDKNPDLYYEANEIFKNDNDYLAGDSFKGSVMFDGADSLLHMVKLKMDTNKIYHKKSIARIAHENNFK